MQVSHYHTLSVPVSDEVREVLSLWKDFMHDTMCQHSVLLAPAFACEAFADACADSASVGMGGYVKFLSGLKRFFQVSFTNACLCEICPFLAPGESPQAFVASFELLAQSALIWTIQAMLPLSHPPLHVVLRCDNSASEASAWKGLSMAKGLCCVLRHFYDLQRRSCISAHIEHVPGFLNEVADSLSRSGDPAALGFVDSERISPPWRELLVRFRPQSAPLEADLSGSVPALR